MYCSVELYNLSLFLFTCEAMPYFSLNVNQTCASLKNWKTLSTLHIHTKCIAHRFTMKNKSLCIWHTGVVGGDGFAMRQNVRNRLYTYYVVQPTVLSAAGKATRVIDKFVKKKKLRQTKTEQNCVLQIRSHQRRDG